MLVENHGDYGYCDIALGLKLSVRYSSRMVFQGRNLPGSYKSTSAKPWFIHFPCTCIICSIVSVEQIRGVLLKISHLENVQWDRPLSTEL